MSSSKKKKILSELTSLQLKTIETTKKFTYRDIMRICKHINKSIFGKQCSLWEGFVANIKANKSPYINFYFRGKKLALHRLLYINYVEVLKDNEFIKYSCKNKGRCCCLNHMIKYTKEIGDIEDSDNNSKNNNNETDENTDNSDIDDEDNSKMDNKNEKNIKNKKKKANINKCECVGVCNCVQKNKKIKKLSNELSKFTISFD
jgi:hypothetical protein